MNLFGITRPPVLTRALLYRDWPEVCAIEAGTADPWLSFDPVTLLGAVAEDDRGAVAGHALYALRPGGVTVRRVAVRADLRRLGYGRALLRRVAGRLTPSRPRATLVVPGGDLDAHLWLRACGWRAVRVDGDRYVFETTLPGESCRGR